MYPSFDQLHVVSDLHIGGDTKEFQIFDQGEVLAALIDHLAKDPPGPRALVINGDFVDFLAEDVPRCFDPEGAVPKLERIFKDDSFSPVWKALERFVKTPNCTLVVILGNHDVELALPTVRERLLVELCGDSSDARGRVIFSFDGTGFACFVAERRVLCLHGNEVDTWNVLDYRTLRNISTAINRTNPVEAWIPNGGSELVINVMNDVKKRFAWVDLMKPENAATIPLLLALHPTKAKEIDGFVRSALRRATDAVRQRIGLLSAEQEPPSVGEGAGSGLEHVLGGAIVSGLEEGASDIAGLFLQAEQRLVSGISSLELVGAGGDETLGLGFSFDFFSKLSPEERLRRSLAKRLESDKTFDASTVDDTFTQVDKVVGDEVDFVVTGHTHLERAMQRGNGKGVYFNSGTWARLVRLSEDMLKPENFGPVYQVLEKGTMTALDGQGELVLRRPTVVSIESGPGGVAGQLRHVEINGSGTTLAPQGDPWTV